MFSVKHGLQRLRIKYTRSLVCFFFLASQWIIFLSITCKMVTAILGRLRLYCAEELPHFNSEDHTFKASMENSHNHGGPIILKVPPDVP